MSPWTTQLFLASFPFAQEPSDQVMHLQGRRCAPLTRCRLSTSPGGSRKGRVLAEHPTQAQPHQSGTGRNQGFTSGIWQCSSLTSAVTLGTWAPPESGRSDMEELHVRLSYTEVPFLGPLASPSLGVIPQRSTGRSWSSYPPIFTKQRFSR